MNWQQTYKGSGFYVGWMRDTLTYNNSLPPSHNTSIPETIQTEHIHGNFFPLFYLPHGLVVQ